MRALVTGAGGFVGPYLVAHLRDCGDDVIASDDGGDGGDGVDVTDRDATHAAFAADQPEVVYHLAAWSDAGASWTDPTACMRINVEGTVNVLDAARACGARRVLVVGSAEEYGLVDTGISRVTEEAPLRPITPYGSSKVAASFLALQAWLGRGLETVRVRPFSHTGAGQSPKFVVPAFARRIARAERENASTITIGARDSVRDFSDVRDVVRAYRLLIERGAPGEVYNVCRGEGYSIGDIVDRLVARSGHELRVEVDEALLRPTEVPILVGDPSKLVRTTGWAPTRTLDDTLDDVLAYARTQGS
jgi:GDP-4-dehydro-6-deoxy-D-mannose reductase